LTHDCAAPRSDNAAQIRGRQRRRWIGRDQFVGRLVQADAALTSDIADLASDTTDDLPLA
jgi:hypothetical protein